MLFRSLPASRLIRRGDVRFKTDTELKRFKVGFADCVKKQLRLMAHDLRLLQPLPQTPKLLCDDARLLKCLLPLDIDAVVTSPPYLNGTNYYRNTKLELWFLRSLHTKADLANFRAQTVTAGINDVTVEKAAEPVNTTVASLIPAVTVCARKFARSALVCSERRNQSSSFVLR